jgi:hypothetical protein
MALSFVSNIRNSLLYVTMEQFEWFVWSGVWKLQITGLDLYNKINLILQEV